MIQSVQHKPGCGVVVRMDDGKVWAFDAKKYLFKTRINGQWMLFIPTEKQRALIFVQWEKAERAHRAATETPEQRAARIKLEVQSFPTPVGVFLASALWFAPAAEFPHARGGVSVSDQSLEATVSVSPRPWGCFPRAHLEELDAESFPTPVGVFPHELRRPLPLPHL